MMLLLILLLLLLFNACHITLLLNHECILKVKIWNWGWLQV
jgi:hypothetical protein